MKAKLKDVAERAGVAKNTASMILNRSPYSWASKETTERVFKSAADLNYQPSRTALAFRRGKTNVIGLVVPDLQNPFYSDLGEIFETLIAKDGYDLVIESSRSDAERERQCLRSVVERQVDGIVCPTIDPERTGPLLEEFAQGGKAVVALLESSSPLLQVDMVAINFTKGIADVMKHLVKLGHHRIAFLISLAEGQDEGKRPLVFRKMMAEAGLSESNAYMVKSDHTLPGAFHAAKALLEQTGPQHPTAFIAHNDLAALGIMRAAKELGLRVPDDLSIVGVDDTLIGKYLPVALTTVHQPTALMMATAAEFLIKRLQKHDYAPPQRQEFETTLIVRESTSAPGVRPWA